MAQSAFRNKTIDIAQELLLYMRLAVLPIGGVITEFNIQGGEWAWGKTAQKKMIVAKSVPGVGNPPGVVIAHEAGHNANIIGDYGTPGDNIMSSPTGGDEKWVFENEKTTYEGL